MMDSAPLAPDTWVLEPDTGPNLGARLSEIWRYRRILGFFAGRALRSLYARTRLGWGWLLIRPLAPLVAGTLVFGGLMSVSSEGIPYFLFFLTGSIIWGFFENPLNWGTRGLELNRNLIAKLYFPRVLLPLATMAAGLVDPLVNSGVLVGTLIYYYLSGGVWYISFEPRLLLAPIAVLTVLTLALSFALALSVWQVRARDVRFGMGYVLGFWFFFTPVIYPLSRIPEAYRDLAFLNPMTGAVLTFKWALLGIEAFYPAGFGYSIACALLGLTAGAWYFVRMENRTADKV
jgi:lipopolysaccharide transport system permease protein